MSFSNIPFSSLKESANVSDKTLRAIADMGLEVMTEIQAETIPKVITKTDTERMMDAIVCSKTGSGKTLAFLIPAVELLHRFKFQIWRDVGVIILSPTRELARQTYSVVKKLMKYHSQSHALISGGKSRKEEADKLIKGINVLVATPGRLIDHIKNNSDFVYKNLVCLVIDEADRMLDMGFEDDMKFIAHSLPTYRQTFLFSATITPKSKELAKRFICQERVLYLGSAKETELKTVATVSTLKQGYFLVPSEKRFLVLHTFLRTKFRTKKIIVFFSSIMSVRFYHDAFNYTLLKCSCMHGKQKQNIRTRTFSQFCKAKSGVLLCTDIAARGLDIPKVDWVIQFDPPIDVERYIHRVGRTARGAENEGNAILFLREEEQKFVSHLRRANVPMKKYDVDYGKIRSKWNLENAQAELENMVLGNYYLKELAKEAFKSTILAYRSHHMKKVFNENNLDHAAIAKSYGFPYIPCRNF